MTSTACNRRMTKSPVRLAREALVVAERALPAYSAVHSPKKFTQPQLFAILVLRQFFKTDYRGIVALLADMSDFEMLSGLEGVAALFPRSATPSSVFSKGGIDLLLASIFRHAKRLGLIERKPGSCRRCDRAGNSSRLTHYVSRRARSGTSASAGPKCDDTGLPHARSHLLAGAAASRGPSQNAEILFPAVYQAGWQLPLRIACWLMPARRCRTQPSALP